MSSPLKLAIAVCTRDREIMLLTCIKSIGALNSHPSFDIEVIICNNNFHPMSQEAINDLAVAAGKSIHVVHEKRAGIPFARNAVLQKARGLGLDWLAFIDDDEVLDENWLIAMSEAIVRWPADIYHGWTQSTPEDLNAKWAFHRPKNKRSSGTVLETAGTDNVLISMKSIEHMTFDEELRYSGGEDLDFFYRAVDSGAKIVWVPSAVTREVIPYSRLSFSYQIRRTYAVASVQAHLARKRFCTAEAFRKILPKALGRLLSGLLGLSCSILLCVVSPYKGRKLFLNSSKKVASSCGLVIGLNNGLTDLYKIVDGA